MIPPLEFHLILVFNNVRLGGLELGRCCWLLDSAHQTIENIIHNQIFNEHYDMLCTN